MFHGVVLITSSVAKLEENKVMFIFAPSVDETSVNNAYCTITGSLKFQASDSRLQGRALGSKCQELSGMPCCPIPGTLKAGIR